MSANAVQQQRECALCWEPCDDLRSTAIGRAVEAPVCGACIEGGVARRSRVRAAAHAIRARLSARPTGEQFWCDLRAALVELGDAEDLDALAIERARRAWARADREARTIHEGEVSQLAERLLLALEHLAAGREGEAAKLFDAIHASSVATAQSAEQGE